jgi:Domain of unknown function (DUF4276)
MTPLRFTLLADGPSDDVLLYPLRWLLIANDVVRPLEPVFADLRHLPTPPRRLEEKVAAALDLYPCDLLFIHRDAERQPPGDRAVEIQQAIQRVSSDLFAARPYVCVVPVRMTEAWFLFDEPAIRRAAGNPAGRSPLRLPPLSKTEVLPDPKQALHELLRTATELPARRLKRFSPVQACRRLAELIEDFSPLRDLPAFSALETELRPIIQAAGWLGGL